MKGPLRSDVSPTAAYEVRCPRCDVSFPVETKVCIHCGGRTAPPDEAGRRGAVAAAAIDWTHETSGDSPFSIESARAERGVGSDGTQDDGSRTIVFDADPEDEPPTTSRSILSSLGGLIWIVLLIGFSIARSCGQ